MSEPPLMLTREDELRSDTLLERIAIKVNRGFAKRWQSIAVRSALRFLYTIAA